MPRSLLAAILAALACVACAPAQALTTSAPPKVHIYTAYDMDFLYLAARDSLKRYYDRSAALLGTDRQGL